VADDRFFTRPSGADTANSTAGKELAEFVDAESEMDCTNGIQKWFSAIGLAHDDRAVDPPEHERLLFGERRSLERDPHDRLRLADHRHKRRHVRKRAERAPGEDRRRNATGGGARRLDTKKLIADVYRTCVNAESETALRRQSSVRKQASVPRASSTVAI
jgi:hypothetical protein